MVVAVVGVSETGAELLTAAGVRDSKAYGSGDAGKKKRADLALWLERLANERREDLVFASMSLGPQRIDDAVGCKGLNKLERDCADGLLRGIVAPEAATIYADGANLFGPMRFQWHNLKAVDHGESAHVAVAAASIIAKNLRDIAMGVIEQKYEREFGRITGGGYVNAGTRKFLEAYKAKYGKYPPETRFSWGAGTDK